MTVIFASVVNPTNPPPTFVGTTFNKTSPADFFDCDLLWVVRGLLKTAGWRVVASSDARALLSNVGDVFTNNTTISPGITNDNNFINLFVAGSICNDYAWIVFKTPLGAPVDFYISIQVLPGNRHWRIKMTTEGFNVAGTLVVATPGTPIVAGQCVVPGVSGPANAEVITFGGGTDALPTSQAFASGGLQRYNIGAETTAATPTFFVTSWQATTNLNNFFMYMDLLTNLTVGDTYTLMGGSHADSIEPQIAATGGSLVIPNYGAVSRFTGGLTTKFSGSTLSNTGETLIGRLSPNIITNKEDLIPLFWNRPTSAPSTPYGFKGVGTLMRWRGAAHDNADMVSTTGVNTFDWMVTKDVLVPWTLAPITAVK